MIRTAAILSGFLCRSGLGLRACACLGLALLMGLTPAQAADNPARAAQAAADQLEAATIALQEAESARDRVAALTETVRAYEAGLAAMRDGLRRVAQRESQLAAQLAAREDDVADLLGVLQMIETSPPPVLMLHPSGPLGAARSAMTLAEVTPALQSRATALKRDLQEVQTLRVLQQSAANTLQDGLNGVQDARVQLSAAIADRTGLPRRFTQDPVRTAILISSTETLSGFASGLAEIARVRSAKATPISAPCVAISRCQSKGWSCGGMAKRMQQVLRGPGGWLLRAPAHWSSLPQRLRSAIRGRFWIWAMSSFWSRSPKRCLCCPAWQRSMAARVK